jgi:hypothetical protein
MTTPTTDTIRIALPSALAGGTSAFFARMGLHSSQNPDGSWNVRRLSPPELVKTLTLSAPWLSERKFDLLDGYAGQADPSASQEAQALFARFDALLVGRRAAGDLTAWLYRAQTAIMAAADSDVAAVADHADSTTIGMLADAGDNPMFPGRSCHAVLFGRELIARSKPRSTD